MTRLWHHIPLKESQIMVANATRSHKINWRHAARITYRRDM